MAHAVSLAYARSDHMSPLAVAMTTALHVSVAAALWWISPLNHIDTTPDPIEITVEVPPEPPQATPQPTPIPEPTPPPAAAQPAMPSPPPAPPTRLGLAPSGTSTGPKATPGAQQPSPPQPNAASTEAAKPEPDKTETPKTETPKADPPKVDQRQAATTPPPPPPPPPVPELENALPPLEAPPPPVTSREIPRPAPPPPAPKPPPPPAQHAQPAPPPPPQRPPQQQALQSSPLSRLPPPRTNEQQQAARQAPAFVNPADMAGQRRIEDQYLWTVSNKLSQHAQFVRNITTEQGTVVLRLVIARDGRLVDVGISRSSGVPSLDNVSLNMVRQAGPYQPLPDAISGASHVFILPLYFRRNE